MLISISKECRDKYVVYGCNMTVLAWYCTLCRLLYFYPHIYVQIQYLTQKRNVVLIGAYTFSSRNTLYVVNIFFKKISPLDCFCNLLSSSIAIWYIGLLVCSNVCSCLSEERMRVTRGSYFPARRLHPLPFKSIRNRCGTPHLELISLTRDNKGQSGHLD